MTKAYEVWLKGKDLKGLVKRYPFRIQAVMWCFLNGYINNCGRFGLCLNDKVEIIEVDE